jgi:hypothetical protein
MTMMAAKTTTTMPFIDGSYRWTLWGDGPLMLKFGNLPGNVHLLRCKFLI